MLQTTILDNSENVYPRSMINHKRNQFHTKNLLTVIVSWLQLVKHTSVHKVNKTKILVKNGSLKAR